MRPRNGIALLLTVGILTLLSVCAVALVGLSARLRTTSGSFCDSTAARLLARSGTEYVSSRLFEDSAPQVSRTQANQGEDWTYRDGPGVPLEKSLNPSYAQTEPYTDIDGDGKYGPDHDALLGGADWNVNGRFDAWSGRLRSRYGGWGGTFRLKVSGEHAEGGINVNGGYLGFPDVEVGNKDVPDYREMGTGLSDQYSVLCANDKLAFALNQLGLLLGTAGPSPAGQAGLLSTPAASGAPGLRVGDAIVRNRPLGGYRSLDELSRLFLPVDWERLRPHLSVWGLRNESAANLFRIYLFSVNNNSKYFNGITDTLSFAPSTGFKCGGWYSPEVRYLVNARASAPEVLAAVFSGIGAPYYQPAYTSFGTSQGAFTPVEAMNAARFIRQTPFVSWYDFYAKLQANAQSLFLPGLAGPSLKAAWLHALAIPEELGPPLYSDASWGTEARKTKGVPLNQENSAHGSLDLGFGAVSRFSVESLGRAVDTNDGIRASRTVESLYEGVGRFQARNQRAFENLEWDPVTRKSVDTHPFAGGFVTGRPSHDRVTTFPCFSRDTLALDPPWDAIPSNYTPPYYCGPFTGGAEAGPVWDNGFCRFYGSARLIEQRWPDPEAVFEQPCWDPDQPARTSLLGVWRSAFDDLKGARLSDASAGALLSSLLEMGTSSGSYGDSSGSVPGDWKLRFKGNPRKIVAADLENISSVFRWGPGESNAGNFPMATAEGNSPSRGTIEGWFGIDGAFGQLNPMWVAGGRISWVQTQPGSSTQTTQLGGGGTGTGGTDDGGMDVSFGDPIGMLASALSGIGGGGGVIASPLEKVAPAFGEVLTSFVSPSPSKDSRTLVSFSFDENEGVKVYENGVYQGGVDSYIVYAIDTTLAQVLQIKDVVDLRCYLTPLPPAAFVPQALRGGYWIADPYDSPAAMNGRDLGTVPCFTSPRYDFNGAVRLAEVAWDGFVAQKIGQDADAWNGANPGNRKVPIRVELVLTTSTNASRVVSLPEESWRTGGIQLDFKTLWRMNYPDEREPLVRSLRYRVWQDCSFLPPPVWKTPVFNGIEVGWRVGRAAGLSEK